MIYTVYKGNVNIILWNDLFWLACIVNVILKTHIICSWIMNFCYIVICNNASRLCFIRSILTRTIYSTLFFVNNKYFGVNICYCFVAISFFSVSFSDKTYDIQHHICTVHFWDFTYIYSLEYTCIVNTHSKYCIVLWLLRYFCDAIVFMK